MPPRKKHTVNLEDGSWELVRNLPLKDITAGIIDVGDLVGEFIVKNIDFLVEHVLEEGTNVPLVRVYAQKQD